MVEVASLARRVNGVLNQVLRARLLRTVGILGFVAYVAVGSATLNFDAGGEDHWQHLASLRALSSNLLSPAPLYIDQPYEVHLYSPYHVFWAAVLALTRLDLWTMLTLMATANAILFALGARCVARYLLRDQALDFATLAVFVTFWRMPVWWSGIYSLGQLPLGASYPSFFATALTLIVGAIWLEEGFRGLPWLVVFALLVSALLPTHPITTSFLIILLVAKALAGYGDRRTRLGATVFVLSAGLVLGLLWPYFSVPTLIREAGNGTEFFGDADAFYRRLTERVGPELIGLPALLLIGDRKLRRLTVLVVAVTLTLYGANYLLEVSHVFSRYLIFATLGLHLAVSGALAGSRERSWAGAVILAFVVVVATAGVGQLRIAYQYPYGLAQDLRRGTPVGTHWTKNKFRDLERLGELASDESMTLLAPLEWGYRVAALTGYRVVGVMHPAPTMPEFEERRRDVEVFYAASATEAAREQIARRWGVDLVLVPIGQREPEIALGDRWMRVYRADRFVVFSYQGDPETPRQDRGRALDSREARSDATELGAQNYGASRVGQNLAWPGP